MPQCSTLAFHGAIGGTSCGVVWFEALMRDDARALRGWGMNKAQERSTAAFGGRLHMQGPPVYISILHALAEAARSRA